MAVKELTLLLLSHSLLIVGIIDEQQQSYDVEKTDSDYEGSNGIQRNRVRIDHWGKLTRFLRIRQCLRPRGCWLIRSFRAYCRQLQGSVGKPAFPWQRLALLV